MSRNFGVGNSDGSNSKDVVNNSSGNSRERSSREGDISRSSDVDGPRSLQVAVVDGSVSELSELFRGQRDGVVEDGVVVTGDEETRPVDVLVDVVRLGSKSGLVSLIASKRSIEDRLEASSGKARSSGSSVLKVERSSEGSSGEDIFSVSRVWKTSSVWVDGSRSPSNVSSGNE